MSTVRRAAFVLVAVSALALTACGPSDDHAAGGAGGPTAGPAKSATPTTPAPTKTAKPAASPGKGSSGGGSGSSDPDYDVFPCSTHDVKFTATLAEPTTSSYLLKITNKGTKTCKALDYPIVTFGTLDGKAKERGPVPDIDHAIRLKPGQSAYAGLMGGANDGKGKTVNSITMTMNTESDLEQTPLKASTPGLYVSPTKNSVTAWMDNSEDALTL